MSMKIAVVAGKSLNFVVNFIQLSKHRKTFRIILLMLLKK